MASERGAHLAKVGDDARGAADDLAGLALGVDLAQPRPLAQLLGLRHRQQRHAVLRAQGLDGQRSFAVVGYRRAQDNSAQLAAAGHPVRHRQQRLCALRLPSTAAEPLTTTGASQRKRGAPLS
jgi:hypothetical protein